jgi:hypothetical protein
MLDFIIRLPLSRFKGKVYDLILVIINKYMKIARYILIIKEINAPELIKLFILHVIKDFGIPSSMTLNKGLIFTSKF